MVVQTRSATRNLSPSLVQPPTAKQEDPSTSPNDAPTTPNLSATLSLTPAMSTESAVSMPAAPPQPPLKLYLYKDRVSTTPMTAHPIRVRGPSQLEQVSSSNLEAKGKEERPPRIHMYKRRVEKREMASEYEQGKGRVEKRKNGGPFELSRVLAKRGILLASWKAG